MSARQYLIAAALLAGIMAPSFALGAGLTSSIVPSDCNNQGGCQNVCDLAILAQNILNAAIVISIFLAAILFAYAGLKMVTAPANPGQRNQGKKLFYNVMVGFIIILAAWLIVNTIMSLLLTGNATSWNKLC